MMLPMKGKRLRTGSIRMFDDRLAACHDPAIECLCFNYALWHPRYMIIQELGMLCFVK